MLNPLRPAVRLLVAALVGAGLGTVTAKYGWFWALVSAGIIGGGYRFFGRRRDSAVGSLARFFALLWGWADYKPKDWSRAPYKRGYAS
jgi:hypothetical protein